MLWVIMVSVFRGAAGMRSTSAFLFRSVQISEKAGLIELLTPLVEPRIDLAQNLFRSEKFPGCGNGARKKKKDCFPDTVLLHVFLLA